jgi:ribose-phosphate pyrophosphokinase
VLVCLCHQVFQRADSLSFSQVSASVKERAKLIGASSMKLISGTSNTQLARAIADYLDAPLTETHIERFADGEIFCRIDANVRGQDVFVIQSTSRPANDNLMELLIIMDALTRASANRITAVIPYFGYARQDRKTGGRTPITAKLAANLIAKAGADRVLTVDLHAGQIQGFFDIPTDNLFATKVIEDDIRRNYSTKDLMIVSPDVGGVVRARALAKLLDDAEIAIVDKRRPKAGVSEVMNIVGDVDGRRCIIFDDMCDSGGTLCNAAIALKKAGATEVSAYATHGVLSNDAQGRIAKSELRELVVTDSVVVPPNSTETDRVRRLGVAPLLGEAIRRIANDESVSKLFD